MTSEERQTIQNLIDTLTDGQTATARGYASLLNLKIPEERYSKVAILTFTDRWDYTDLGLTLHPSGDPVLFPSLAWAEEFGEKELNGVKVYVKLP